MVVETTVFNGRPPPVLLALALAKYEDVGRYFAMMESTSDMQPSAILGFPLGRYLPHEFFTDDMTSFKVKALQETSHDWDFESNSISVTER